MELQYFDLLDNEPIYIESVGTLKPPTLRDIKKIYTLYDTFTVFLIVDINKYLQLVGLDKEYTEEDTKLLNIYNLIINNDHILDLYQMMFSFFFCENVAFDKRNKKFIIWKEVYDEETQENKNVIVGYIHKDNFDDVRSCIAQLNHLDNKNIKPPKYKNNRAKKIAEKIAKGQAEMEKKSKSKLNLDLPHMISKYCADNKNGINLLNVYNLNIYQFYDQFIQHNHIRQSDIQDAIYTNTVSFSDTKSYDSDLWLK